MLSLNSEKLQTERPRYSKYELFADNNRQY